MSTVITINGTDRTDKFNSFDLEVTKNKRTYNTLRGRLFTEEFTIEEGTDIQLTIDGNLEFGGLVQNIRNKPTTVQNEYTIYATAYEQITDRRTIGFTYDDEDAGDIVNELVTDYLASENITVGNIDTGAKITWTKNASSIRDIMDELALSSGYVWFIDNDKKLYFQDDYNYTASTFPTDYEVVEVGRSLTGYSNKVFVLGGNNVKVVAESSAEQAKMAARYGTGVYGTIIRDQKADTEAKAQAVADARLAKTAFDKKYVRIKTRTRLVEGALYTGITIPYTDVDTEDYAIDEVVINCIGDRFTYTATLEPYETAIVSTNKSWQERFREFANKKNEDVTSVASGEYGSFYDIPDLSGGGILIGTTATGDTDRELDVTLPYVSDCMTTLTVGYTATGSDTVTLVYKNNGTTKYTLPFDVVTGEGTKTFTIPETQQPAGTYTVNFEWSASTGGLVTLDSYIHATRWERYVQAWTPDPTGNVYEVLAETTITSATNSIDLTGFTINKGDLIMLGLEIDSNATLDNTYRIAPFTGGAVTSYSNLMSISGSLEIQDDFSNATFTSAAQNGKTYVQAELRLAESGVFEVYTTATRTYNGAVSVIVDGGVITTTTFSNITTLRLTSVNANGFGVGTKATLYKKGSAN